MIKEFFNPPSVSHLRLVNNNVMVGLVHKLAIRLTSEQSPIITFIAAVSGEGTSTIADMFAAALAEEQDRRVLCIETGANTSKTVGVVDIIASGHDPSAILTQSGHQIARVAWMINRDYRSLAGKLLKDASFWQKLRQSFDAIIIDTPALQSSPEGIGFAQQSTMTILVTAAETTRKHVIENLRDTLRKAGATIAGIVLNKRRMYTPTQR